MANAAAATALARSIGVPAPDIKQALINFRLDAHRIELVAEHNDVRWIDDSKATNPHAAAASLNSFQKVIWVVGGLLKGVDLSDLVAKYANRISCAIVIGKDRLPVLEALAKGAPNSKVIEISDTENVMHDVVRAAKQLAVSGDVVLLAPAAASMDQFKDYADRGNQFAEQVKLQLEEI
jgi:UDP-N-acetylmuramoylalanine--D-glutamate ligase